MSIKSLLLLIISAALALSLAVTVRGYVSEAAPKQPEGNRVLVAARTITQGSFVKADQDFTWAVWPKENIGEGHLVEGQFPPETLNGAVVRRQIPKGEPISEAALVKSSEGGFMAAVLEPGGCAPSPSPWTKPAAMPVSSSPVTA